MFTVPLRVLRGGVFGLALGCAAQKAEPASTAPETRSAEVASRPLLPGPAWPAPRAAIRLPLRTQPWLGVEVGEPNGASPGVPVKRVLLGSPAARARLSEGDVLVSANGEPLFRAGALGELVRASDITETVRLEVKRGDSSGVVEVPLEAAPDPEDIARLALVGWPAPEISGVVTFQGDVASLRELRGRVVLLEFWASYCVACRALVGTLDSLQTEYGGRGLVVVGVTVDPLELGAEVARKLGMTYSLASDPAQRITSQYMARQIPMLVLIDRRGEVREVTVGPSPERMTELEAELAGLLVEKI